MNGCNNPTIKLDLLAIGHFHELKDDPLKLWVNEPKTLQANIDVRGNIISFLSGRRIELRTQLKATPEDQASKAELIRDRLKEVVEELSRYAVLQYHAKRHLKNIYSQRRLNRKRAH